MASAQAGIPFTTYQIGIKGPKNDVRIIKFLHSGNNSIQVDDSKIRGWQKWFMRGKKREIYSAGLAAKKLMNNPDQKKVEDYYEKLLNTGQLSEKNAAAILKHGKGIPYVIANKMLNLIESPALRWEVLKNQNALYNLSRETDNNKKRLINDTIKNEINENINNFLENWKDSGPNQDHYYRACVASALVKYVNTPGSQPVEAYNVPVLLGTVCEYGRAGGINKDVMLNLMIQMKTLPNINDIRENLLLTMINGGRGWEYALNQLYSKGGLEDTLALLGFLVKNQNQLPEGAQVEIAERIFDDSQRQPESDSKTALLKEISELIALPNWKTISGICIYAKIYLVRAFVQLVSWPEFGLSLKPY
jgi:hypothetical protein